MPKPRITITIWAKARSEVVKKISARFFFLKKTTDIKNALSITDRFKNIAISMFMLPLPLLL
jgi:hypothetical protein